MTPQQLADWIREELKLTDALARSESAIDRQTFEEVMEAVRLNQRVYARRDLLLKLAAHFELDVTSPAE